MPKRTDYFRIALLVVAWIIFVGLSIEAGGFLTKAIATLLLTPEGATRFWTQVDLSKLYHFNQSHYVMLASIMIIAVVLKAIMFYVIVRILHDRRLNLSKPFNELVRRFVLIIAYLALGIGLFSYWGARLTAQLLEQGVVIPDVQQLRLGGGDVWVFMGIIMLVVAFIFKKGVEMQTENDLTV